MGKTAFNLFRLALRGVVGAAGLVGCIYLLVLFLGSGMGRRPAPPVAAEPPPPVLSPDEHESPFLAKMVKEGKLPPLPERIGTEPAVLPGTPGRYGGDLWLLAHDIDEVRVALQYAYRGEGLVRFSPDGLPVLNHMARSLEHSADFKVWTVTLRKGAKWSDGVPLTSEDFLWWAKNVWGEEEMGGMPEIWRSASGSARLEAVSPECFRVIFPDPRPDWRRSLASPAGSLYTPGPKHYMLQYHPKLGNPEAIRREGEALGLKPRELFNRKAGILNPERPGLGPWLIRSQSQQGPWTAVRNPYYPAVDSAGRQLPYIDRLVFRQVSKPLQPRAVTDGLASFAWNTPIDYPSLMNERGPGHYRVFAWHSLDRGGMQIVPNRRLRVSPGDKEAAARAKLLREPDFRRALSLAINRKAVIKAEFDGIGEPAGLGPGPEDFGYQPEHLLANATYDPARANALLDKLGLTRRDEQGARLAPDGSRLRFEMIARPGHASPLEFIADFWKAVGIYVTAQEKPLRLFLRSEQTADFSLGKNSSPEPGTVGPLAADAPFFQWMLKGGLVGNPESKQAGVDQPDAIEEHAMRLASEENEGASDARRLEIAHELMEISRENVWAINVFAPESMPVVAKEGLMNFPHEALAGFKAGMPFNAFPEMWYWSDPDKINGMQTASADYQKDRAIAIAADLNRMAPHAGSGAVAKTATKAKGMKGGAAAHSTTSKLMRGLFLGILVVVLLMAILRHPWLLQRLALMVPTLLTISIVVFIGVQLPPGSYLETVTENLREQGNSAAAQIEIHRLEELYHLNDSLPKRYLRWMGAFWFTSFDEADAGILQGNLGRSMANDNRPVNDLIGDRLLLTMALSFGAILIQWFVALPVGVYSAIRQNTASDYVLTVGGLIGMCIPDFILALLAILAAKQVFGLVAIGMFSSQFALQPYWDWAKFLDLLKHIWVPILILGTASTAGLIRVTRANLLDELRKPYVTTARAKGMRPMKLLLKYPFRLALNPFIAGIGSVFPALISGSAIVSIILSLPTIGPMLYDSVMLEDTSMAGSLLLCVSALSIFGILVSDLLLLLLDPRIRFGGSSR